MGSNWSRHDRLVEIWCSRCRYRIDLPILASASEMACSRGFFSGRMEQCQHLAQVCLHFRETRCGSGNPWFDGLLGSEIEILLQRLHQSPASSWPGCGLDIRRWRSKFWSHPGWTAFFGRLSFVYAGNRPPAKSYWLFASFAASESVSAGRA